ncbi:MAG: hypothetical protein M1840_009119 [Geoglossum simile]|nr:MAG: hypothetical protein M1840_009119 [Geoglossum simile]
MAPVSISNDINSLYEAVRSGSIVVVRKYIRAQKKPSDVDWDARSGAIRNDWTPLMLAVDSNYERIVKELLKHSSPGPTVDATERRFLQTPLMMAALSNRFRIALMLLDANPKLRHLDMKDRLNSETALVTAARNGNWETARTIVMYGPTIDFQNADRDGALHFAIKNKKTSLVRRMLDGRKGKAAAKQKDSGGNTPLHLAVLTGIPIMVQEILDAEAPKADTDVWGHTAEYLATAEGDNAMAALIRRHK